MTRVIHRSAVAVALAAFLFTAAGALTATAPALAAPGPKASATTKASAKPTPALQGKVNINEADEAQLRMLPGVGETKAARIVAWRKKNGRFKRVKDLRRVKGFGKKSVERLAPYLAVAGPTTLRKGG